MNVLPADLEFIFCLQNFTAELYYISYHCPVILSVRLELFRMQIQQGPKHNSLIYLDVLVIRVSYSEGRNSANLTYTSTSFLDVVVNDYQYLFLNVFLVMPNRQTNHIEVILNTWKYKKYRCEVIR